MIKVGTSDVTFPYSKIYVGDTKVWEAQAPGPSQYLNYIESTGTQYIDPNIDSFEGGDTIEIDFQLTDDAQGSNTYLLGMKTGQTGISTYVEEYKYTGAGTRYWGSGRRHTTININTPDTLRHTLKYNLATTTITFDGTDITYSPNNTNGGYLFAGEQRLLSGSEYIRTPIGNIKARVYSFKVKNIYAQTTLELVPVLDGNGVPCMWDTVSQTFFYNQGTGDFLYG